MKWLKGKKTHIISGLMVFVGLIKLITGDMSLAEFVMSGEVMTMLEGFGLSALRAGVAKKS